MLKDPGIGKRFVPIIPDEASDIQDAAPTAGMSQTTSFPAGADWSATRLIARHAGSNKKKTKQ